MSCCFTQPTLRPIAGHRISKPLGRRKADPDLILWGSAGADLQDECRRNPAPPRSSHGKEFTTTLEARDLDRSDILSIRDGVISEIA
jgi:hypothetical protein